MTQASQSKLTLGLLLELLGKRSFPASGVAKVALPVWSLASHRKSLLENKANKEENRGRLCMERDS